ncbi:MAG: DUF433 domain-containing protein [Chloroflexi bacterium]|nr:DUF433 domain-containing protein [Chloroflexota bacterium]
MEKLDRIISDPLICLGQPIIRGTRITLSIILRLLASGWSEQDVIAAYPELTPQDIHQAAQYNLP